MLNRIILIGRLTQDPELRYTDSGTAVASFTLAVDRMRTNQSGQRETDFINCVVWQKQAEICAQYLHKGRLAGVDGRLQIRSYENREGQKVRVAEVVCESVRFLDRGDQQPNQATSNRGQGTQPRPTSTPNRFDDDPFADDEPSMYPQRYSDDPFADDLPA